MIPQRVKLSGFLSYKDEQEVRFDGSQLWMLSGTNGSGKSSIFDAVTYASTLPDSDEATLAVFDASGSRLAELRVRDDTFAAI